MWPPLKVRLLQYHNAAHLASRHSLSFSINQNRSKQKSISLNWRRTEVTFQQTGPLMLGFSWSAQAKMKKKRFLKGCCKFSFNSRDL